MDTETDFLTHAGAMRLVAKLQTYWFDRGYMGFKTNLEKISQGSEHALYCVRSNIGARGWPPK